MTDTGWHRHDNGTVHRDDAGCTWLGNPVPCPPPDPIVESPTHGVWLAGSDRVVEGEPRGG